MMSDVTLHYIRDMVAIARERLAELGRPAREFRLSNFWAWHVKKDRDTSMREARRELILRGWLVRYHIEHFMTPEECDFIEAHKSAFLKAYNDRSGDIKGVPAAMVDKLIDNFSCAGDFSTIDRACRQPEGVRRVRPHRDRAAAARRSDGRHPNDRRAGYSRPALIRAGIPRVVATRR